MQGQIEQLFRHYYKDLRMYLTPRCSDAHAVEDIIQNTFLQALRSIERFRGDSSLKTWLFSIARHELYRSYRNNKDQLARIDDVTEPWADDGEAFYNNVLAGEVMESIGRLSPLLGEIMRLRLIHELSFKEIADRVGRSENYCRVNYFRIRQKLREEYGYEDL